jgi:hypothetical protein
MTMPATIKYAVYPGTVTLYGGDTATFTALELATLYGVQDEPYLTVNNNTQIPAGESYFKYIHLKPRADGIYSNIKTEAQDDDQVITMGEDFDGSKTYIQETDPNAIDKDIDMPHN